MINQEPLFIIFIHLGLGGVERKIVDLVNTLVTNRSNFPIYVLLQKKTAFSIRNQIINKRVIVITYTDWGKIRIPFFFIGFVLFYVWKLKPKAILSFLDMPSYAAVLAKKLFFWRDIRVVIGSDHYASRVIATYNFPKLRLFLVRILYPFADRIITCTNATKKDLIDSFSIPSQKIKIIKNWTYPSSKKSESTLYDYVYAGRLEKEKNVLRLLNIFQRLVTKNKKLTLFIIGDGSQKPLLQDFVKTHALSNNIVFAGAVQNVKEYIRKAALFLYTPNNKADGFPITLLESMSAGVPVLTRYFDGADEVIQNGINGFIAHSRKEFIQKTMWLLNHPKIRNQVAVQARKYVAKYHTPANMQTYFDELKI